MPPKKNKNTASHTNSEASSVALLVSAISFFGLFLCTIFGLNFLYQDLAEVTEPVATISTQSVGEVYAVPDQVRVNIGVMEADIDIKTAQKKAQDKIDELNKALRKLGIDESHIKTQYFSVNSNYDWSVQPRVLTGYTANHTLGVTVNNVDIVDKVIEIIISEVGVDVQNVQFVLKDETKKSVLLQARDKALARAENQALDIAGQQGKNLKELISVKVFEDTNAVSYYDEVNYGRGGGGGYGGHVFQFGQIKVSQTAFTEYIVE